MIDSIKRVTDEDVRPLRHKVLRPNQPLDACVYPLDAIEDTRHFAAYLNGRIVGVASIFREPRPDHVEETAWRIRGMATLEEVRGKGYGGALVEACIDYVRSQKGTAIWCNARTTVTGFYGRFGFEPEGDEFELPAIGPHYLMVFRLG